MARPCDLSGGSGGDSAITVNERSGDEERGGFMRSEELCRYGER